MKEQGFSLVEVQVGLGLLLLMAVAAMTFSSMNEKKIQLLRTRSAQERIVSAVRTFAGMPAALRNSMRASTGGQQKNPVLYACTSGNPANSCPNGGAQIPLTLYSPLVALDGAGNPVGIRAVSAPSNSPTGARFDVFGQPCTIPSSECPIEVFTSFQAQCPPAPVPLLDPSVVNPALLVQMPVCTIADLIHVTYTIRLDPNLAGQYPVLQSFIKPVTGSIATPVLQISGNMAQ
jgi:hypothetical protein